MRMEITKQAKVRYNILQADVMINKDEERHDGQAKMKSKITQKIIVMRNEEYTT